jgi:hypothetical protein
MRGSNPMMLEPSRPMIAEMRWQSVERPGALWAAPQQVNFGMKSDCRKHVSASYLGRELFDLACA